MNYIKRLQEQKTQLCDEKVAGLDALHDLYRYLQSEKFHTDTTVQISDVFARLEPVRKALIGELLS